MVDESEIVEQQIVSGIAYSRDEAKVTLVGVADRPGVAATIFGPLAEAGVNVDMIVQSVSADGETTDLTFTVGRGRSRARRRARSSRCARSSAAGGSIADGEVVKISVIGVGMRSHAGIAHTMFSTLAERGINIQAISTSEIKISILIDEAYTELALRALHTAYGLDAGLSRRRPPGGAARPAVARRNRVPRLPVSAAGRRDDLGLGAHAWSRRSPMPAASACSPAAR